MPVGTIFCPPRRGRNVNVFGTVVCPPRGDQNVDVFGDLIPSTMQGLGYGHMPISSSPSCPWLPDPSWSCCVCVLPVQSMCVYRMVDGWIDG